MVNRGPVIALDVDGVLSPDPMWISGGAATLSGLGYRPHHYSGAGPDGTPGTGRTATAPVAAHVVATGDIVTGTVWLNPQHGVWLRALIAGGADVVWATGWGQRAAAWIAPRLGLPDLPVLAVPRHGPAFGWSPKLGPISSYAQDRSLAWIDDQFGGKEFGWAEDRRELGIPTLLLATDPGRGLESAHVDTCLEWLTTC